MSYYSYLTRHRKPASRYQLHPRIAYALLANGIGNSEINPGRYSAVSDLSAGTNVPVREYDPHEGFYYHLDGTNKILTGIDEPFRFSGDFSISIRFKLPSVSALRILVGKRNNVFFWFGHLNTGTLRFNLNGFAYTTSGSYDDGVWRTVTFGRKAGLCVMYIEGVLAGSFSRSDTITSADEVAVGDWGETGGYPARADISFCYIADNSFLIDEQYAVYQNPWQFLDNEYYPVYVPGAAPAGTILPHRMRY